MLIAAFSLIATQSLALQSIADSKHDLSSASGSGGITSDYDEICVFCHTPHMADTSNANAPLWNRDQTGITINATLYNSATLDPDSKGNAVYNSIVASDAPLCLSCHDGGTLANGLVNPPNSNIADPTLVGGSNADGTISATADIGLELHDDHPIGMVYQDVYDNTTTEFRAPVGGKVSTLPLYNGVMWCSSCHDVHDQTNYPFLATDNNQSGLCLTCHLK
jgi:predicted CXXCH cytochrome family protein